MKGLVCHYLCVGFFSLLDWKWRLSSPLQTLLLTSLLYLSSFLLPLFFSFPRLAWKPCNSQLPLQLPWLVFSPVFSVFESAGSQYLSLYLAVTHANRECSNCFLKCRSLKESVSNCTQTGQRWNGLFLHFCVTERLLKALRGHRKWQCDYMWMARKPCRKVVRMCVYVCSVNCVTGRPSLSKEGQDEAFQT